MKLQPDTLFANRYQLERLLGRGGFSEVWLAKDNWTHLRVALKVYAPGQGMDANGLQDFCGELANVFDLNHTNLLKPTHVDTWDDMPYLIMPYCSNGSLTSKIGQLSEADIWKLIHDVASGLAYLHERDVVHQDIKPDNILIDEFGNYVITDFGISTRARSTLRKSVIGGSVSGGTMAYMGPERFSQNPAPTKASDIWSFGAMLFEIIEGNVPFGEIGGGLQKGGAEIPCFTSNVSDALKDTIVKMLCKDTWDRPSAETLVAWSQNPRSVENDHKVAVSRETQLLSTPSSPKEREPRKKSKVWLWVIGCIVAVPILLFSYVLFSDGLYFAGTQIEVHCGPEGLNDYFGDVHVYEPITGTRLSDWWWDICEISSSHYARKTEGGFLLDVSPNRSTETRELTFDLRPKIGKFRTVTIIQGGRSKRRSSIDADSKK